MAEIKRPFMLNGMTCFFRDNTGLLYPTSGTVDCIVSDSLLHSLHPTRTHTEIKTQQGGDVASYAFVHEYSDAMEFDATVLLRDPSNATDRTIYALLAQLNQANTFSAPFATWASTNPTPGGGNSLAVDMVITHIRALGTSTNVTYTAAIGVKSIGNLQAVEKVLGYQVKFSVMETWSIV